MTHITSTRRRSSQKGSALLIVFVFAAMIAIMLYKEMPVAAFEAQRQKEQLLMDRGNEYKRAVKLYVRKFQTFPPSIEALENTNRMRFLRNRYVDPYSGKDDWRLLHAGPGGIIIDSKIKVNVLGPGGASGGPGAPGSPTTSAASSSSFGSPFSSASFGGSAGFASSPNANAQPNTGTAVGPNGQPAQQAMTIPVRPPAIAASGGDGAIPQDGQSTDGQQNLGSIPAPYPGSTGNAGSSPDTAGPPFPPGPGRFRNGTAMAMADPNNPGQQPDGTAQDPQAMLQAMLQNQSNPQQAVQLPNGFNGNNSNNPAGNANTTPSAFGANPQANQNGSQMGQMGNGQSGGGIAGVASKTTGSTIKVFKDQKDRSLWEFVYDMQQEANANAPGLGNANGSAPNGAINGQQNTQSNASGFNSPNQNNSFGNSSTPPPTQPSTPPPTNQ